jgi:hypothetical protein
MPDKASDPLLAQLSKTLEKDEEQREAMIKKIKVGCAECSALLDRTGAQQAGVGNCLLG